MPFRSFSPPALADDMLGVDKGTASYEQVPAHLREVGRPRQRRQLRDRQAGIPAGVDARERLQVHVDVQAQAVEAAAPAHPQAQLGNFSAVAFTAQVDPRGIGTGRRFNTVCR